MVPLVPKRHPATKGFAVSHQCGHSHKHRTDLLWLARRPRSEESDKEVEKFINEEISLREKKACPNCAAELEYENVRYELAKTFQAFSLPVPKELEGSTRQKAWGESVRLRMAENIVRMGFYAFFTPQLGNLIAWNILNLNEPRTFDESLVESIHKVRVHFIETADFPLHTVVNNSIEDIEIAGSILVIRRMLQPIVAFANNEPDAKRWMMWDKFRQGPMRDVEYRKIDAHLVLHSMVALSIEPDASLDNLSSLVRLFDSHYSQSDRRTLEKLRHHSTNTRELLDTYQAYKAIHPQTDSVF